MPLTTLGNTCLPGPRTGSGIRQVFLLLQGAGSTAAKSSLNLIMRADAVLTRCICFQVTRKRCIISLKRHPQSNSVLAKVQKIIVCELAEINLHQRCAYSDSPFAMIHFYTAGSRKGSEGGNQVPVIKSAANAASLGTLLL